jgi:hypothetical protein
MPEPTTSRRRAVPPSVAGRLTRVENLLVEMRHEQDVSLKRLTRLQTQLDYLTDTATREPIRLPRKSAK